MFKNCKPSLVLLLIEEDELLLHAIGEYELERVYLLVREINGFEIQVALI